MTRTKERAQVRHYTAELRNCVEKTGRSVSAGELAKQMGVSRTTAKKWLEECVKFGKVLSHDFTHVNNFTATRYYPEKM